MLVVERFAQQKVAELMDDCYRSGAEIKDTTKALCVIVIELHGRLAAANRSSYGSVPLMLM